VKSVKPVLFHCLAILLSLVLLEIGFLVVLHLNGFYFQSGSSHMRELHAPMLPDNIRPNKRYIWSYIPFSSYTYVDSSAKKRFSVSINSESFRDKEPSERSSKAFSFIALGDSFTFGWLVDYQERWDQVLKGLVEKNFPVKAEAINRAMWMSTFDQHALLLEDNWVRSDMIIHLVYPSHLQTIMRHSDVIRDGRIVTVRDPILVINRNRLLFQLGDVLMEKRLYFPFSICGFKYLFNRYRFNALKGTDLSMIQAVPDKLIDEGGARPGLDQAYKLMGISIHQIAEFAREHKVPYVVVIVPTRRQVRPSESRAQAVSDGIPQERIMKICRDTGYARCLDLLGVFRENASNGLYYKTDFHWTPEGHALAAREILKFIRANDLKDRISEPVR
jgi:hypothetical protein